MEPLVIALMGPTAMGKTEVAMAVAERFAVDLVSADSALVYRGLDVGTAKPSLEERAAVPHALVDIVPPTARYSVADWVRDASRCVAASHAAGRVPLLVGGTMLYFKRVFEGLAPLPPADVALRAALDARAERLGWPALHAQLREVDPAAARRIAPADSQRIQRALEVYQLTGMPISQLQQRAPERPDWCWQRFALLSADRASLHARIGARFDAMLAAGLEAEVRQLLDMPGMQDDLPSMRSVGYRQMSHYLAGQCDRDQAIADAKTATRRLAKRQHTWLRGMADVCCLDPLEDGAIDRISEQLEGAGVAPR